MVSSDEISCGTSLAMSLPKEELINSGLFEILVDVEL
jgi:hypothetical protein